MPGLKPTLAKYDLDFLLRIARAWGLQISQRDAESARIDLAARMVDPGLFHACIESLGEPIRTAWEDLARKGGRLPWAEFSRVYGNIRNFGPARRERENPDLHPASTSESLWYSGLVGRAFLRGASEPVEYVYIPNELLNFFTPTGTDIEVRSIRPAVNQTPKHITRSEGVVLDHLTDLLAASRMQRVIPEQVFITWRIPHLFMQQLLRTIGLVNQSGQPDQETVKTFFSADRDHALFQLYQAWFNSTEINELRMLPGLTFEGSWQNDSFAPRSLLTGLLSSLQTGTWWSISSLIASVKDSQPDFQRPAGDYDSWFIREEDTTNYLRGFESWDRVEGALLYFLLSGPLHWLGVVDLARGSADGKFTAFRLKNQTVGMLTGNPPKTGARENQAIKVKDVSHFSIPNFAPRTLRYQVARFCELERAAQGETWYSLTPDSLNIAANQGLQLTQLLQLLDKEQSSVIPAPLTKLAERWGHKGQEAAFESAALLRFKDEAACLEFLKAAESRFCLEQLNSRTLLISLRQQEAIIKVLNELGILVMREADV